MRTFTVIFLIMIISGCHNFNKKYDGDCVVIENDIGTMIKCPTEEAHYIDFKDKEVPEEVEEPEVNEETEELCKVIDVEEGVILDCVGQDAVLIRDGQDGQDGTDGQDGVDGEDGQDGEQGEQGEDGQDAVIEIIDPCGDDSGHSDEVILVLADGTFLAYSQEGSNRHLAVIYPGTYRTTDHQRCLFTITEDYEYLED